MRIQEKAGLQLRFVFELDADFHLVSFAIGSAAEAR
jgi:hypothetical protein